jgi:predicted NAD/FAD-binding protein
MKNPQTQEKVAIIGSGISGLACAYFLDDYFDIKLYEKNDYLGGHSNTAKINYDGVDIAVDTGFIVFNYQTYPNLVKFFELLKVEVKKSNMSFAVKINDSQLEYAGTSLGSLFAQKKNLFDIKFLQMIFDILRFNKKAVELLNKEQSPNYSIKNFLDDLKLKEYFQQYYLLPMASAIWSSPLEKIIDYPAQSFVNFFKNHGLLSVSNQPQWYTVEGGSCEYVKKISQKISQEFSQKISNKISCNDSVKKIYHDPQGKIVVVSEKSQEVFDKIIIATHSDQALAMLTNPSDIQQEILKNIKYQENIAILHKDQSLMPKAKKAWASWVYSSKSNNKQDLSVTYWMNNLQAIDAKYPLFVTLNPNQEIDKNKIFAKYQYHHPIFDSEAIIAQQKISQMQGQNNIYFCGAYQAFGFHEDGLKSALNVLNKLKIKAPWQL